MKKVVCLIAILIVIKINAQNYPPQIHLDSIGQEPYTPPISVPAYLTPDTLTGYKYQDNIITRVSDPSVFGITGQRLSNNYSSDGAWNSDGTLLKLAGYPAAILDGKTYQFLYWRSIPGYGRWSHTQPNIIYGVSGNTFKSHDVLLNTSTVLHTFSGFTSVDFGYGEGNQDYNDKYVGLIGENGSDKTLIVYDIQNDSIVGTKFLGSSGDLDWFSVSPLGNYAIVSWRPDGNGTTEGIKRYNIDLTGEIHFSNYSAHGDMGLDQNGDEVMVSFGDNDMWSINYYLRMERLSDANVTPLFYWNPSKTHSGIWGGHISLRNIDRQGWAYVSEGCCDSHPTMPGEVFAIKLDTSKIVERFCNSNTDETVGYGHEAKASVSRDGTKIVFTSNWYDSTLKANDALAFVVEVPQADTALPIANASNDTTICPTDSIVLVATGGNSYSWNTGDTTSTIIISPNTQTTYIVTVSNAYGSDKDTVVVSVDTNLCEPKICENTMPISIDGTQEAAWTNVYMDTMSKLIAGSVSNALDLSATYKLMWDNTGLYVIVFVDDDIKTNDSPNEWEDDGIEIFLDIDNDKNSTYESDDRQYIIRWNDNTVYEHGFNTQQNPTGVSFAQINTPAGYIIEGKINWSAIGLTPSANQTIGFEIQVNDDDNGGSSLEARKSWEALISPSGDASVMGEKSLGTSACNNTTNIKLTANKEIKIYPNPTSGEFLIKYDKMITSYKLYNTKGELVLSEKVNATKKQVNISNLTKGTYFIEAITEENTYREKIVKN